MEKEVIQAIDINIETPFESAGTAYYRLTKEMKEFLDMVHEKNGIAGFEWDGSYNFGVITKSKS